MRKSITILPLLAILLSACSMGSAEPTAIPLPTAFPSSTPPVLNQPAEAVNNADAGQERVSNADGMPAAYVPDGSFRMGALDPDEQRDEKPDHNVTMKGFWMDKLEVTNAMYALCSQAGACEPPQTFKSQTRESYFNNPEFNDYPVVYVTSYQAQLYCEWAGRRLPTEAEWEYAARGGRRTQGYKYAGGNELGSVAWHDGNSNKKTHAVGGKQANELGLYDMSGNVWEWVQDVYVNSYNGAPTDGSARTSGGTVRVLRGGACNYDYDDVFRVSDRNDYVPPVRVRLKLIGFRLAED